jgi:hypothetical protein
VLIRAFDLIPKLSIDWRVRWDLFERDGIYSRIETKSWNFERKRGALWRLFVTTILDSWGTVLYPPPPIPVIPVGIRFHSGFILVLVWKWASLESPESPESPEIPVSGNKKNLPSQFSHSENTEQIRWNKIKSKQIQTNQEK